MKRPILLLFAFLAGLVVVSLVYYVREELRIPSPSPPGGSGGRPPLSGIIRRILRGASMTGDFDRRTLPPGRYGLESVKKTLQVVWVGTGLPVRRLP